MHSWEQPPWTPLSAARPQSSLHRTKSGEWSSSLWTELPKRTQFQFLMMWMWALAHSSLYLSRLIFLWVVIILDITFAWLTIFVRALMLSSEKSWYWPFRKTLIFLMMSISWSRLASEKKSLMRFPVIWEAKLAFLNPKNSKRPSSRSPLFFLSLASVAF